SYTLQVAGVNGSAGIGMVEIYDADGSGAATRLVNLSTRGYVGTGDDVMVAGFVISGDSDSEETVLIRGIGPGLASYGFSGTLTNPVLTLYGSKVNVLDSNTGWGGTTALTDAMKSVGAFSLPADSADSAILVSLPPGSYTAQLSGSGGGTGLGLIEIYEVK
ncbi:MAG: hypothetical protein ACREFX_11545, partial [Opitutaceae bacterium]